MSNIAIKVENLGKLYRIGGPQERYQTFRDAITRAAVAPFKRARDLLRGQAYGAANLQEEIWALKDVSFEIKHGEVVGIIGRNGAGKSTLLKILSRITEPTTGYADIYGRVGALLEVGTGFHPELTGRENIYLNGAILGMSRNDIDRKFDEIVAFSGVEKFIDTPVKHYSSGMGLRLGFSVAAHLEPEILVVDEVLAVGDAEFQKKCLGKMSDVAGEGRTVLFVSHNVVAVQHLCSRAILLNSGTLETIGNAYQVVNQYTYTASSRNTIDSLVHAPRVGKGDVKFNSITFLDEHNRPLSSLLCGDPLNIRLDIGNHNDIHNVRVSIDFVDSLGQTVTILDGAYVGIIKYLPANSSIYFYIPKLQLVPGTYGLTLYLQAPIGVVQDWLTQAIFIEVLEGDYYKSGKAVKSGSQVFVSDFELRATE